MFMVVVHYNTKTKLKDYFFPVVKPDVFSIHDEDLQFCLVLWEIIQYFTCF